MSEEAPQDHCSWLTSLRYPVLLVRLLITFTVDVAAGRENTWMLLRFTKTARG